MSGPSWKANQDFLATAVACAKSTTVTNVTDFTSRSIRVSRGIHYSGEFCLLTITFTRTTGTSSEVDFEFQASFDDGTTWCTDAFIKISIATNRTAVSNVVRHCSVELIPGVSHLRLYRIVNNDASTDLTACNATLSIGGD